MLGKPPRDEPGCSRLDVTRHPLAGEGAWCGSALFGTDPVRHILCFPRIAHHAAGDLQIILNEATSRLHTVVVRQLVAAIGRGWS